MSTTQLKMDSSPRPQLTAVKFRFKLLQGSVGPGVRIFLPCFALCGDEVGEVESAVAAALAEVEECLCGAVEVERGAEAVFGPFHRSQPFGLRVLQGAEVVDQHRVPDAFFLGLLRTVAGVEVAGDAFILEDDGPRDLRGI